MRTYQIDRVNKTMIFSFDQSEEEIIDRIKYSSYKSRWNKEFQHWIVTIDQDSKSKLIHIVKDFGFQFEEMPVEHGVEYDYSLPKPVFEKLRTLCDSKNFAYPPRDYQIEALGFSLAKGNVIVGDDVGLGKCEYVENRVFTPTGRKRIGDIAAGDKVIGSNGKSITVTEVHPQKELKKLYRVTFNDNYSVLVSNDHLFQVSAETYSKKYLLSVDQMIDKDNILERKGEGRNSGKVYKTKTYFKQKNGGLKWQIPVTRPIEFESSKKLPIDPYLFGLMLGDGHFTPSGSCHFDVSKEDFEELLSGVEFDEVKTDENKRKASIKFTRHHIKNFGLSSKRSHEKFIPKEYLYSSIKNRLALLQGLLDTDGYCSQKKKGTSSIVEYYSTSERLADNVAEMVQGLGGVASKRKKIGKYKDKNGCVVECKTCFTIRVKLPKQFLPFRLKRKSKLYTFSDKYEVTRYIKDISFERSAESVCISVDAPDHLYVTEHGIVTHNTYESILYAEVTNSFPCLVVVPASVKYNWQEKWEEITGKKRSISVIESKETKKRVNDWNADVVVINYDIIGKKQGTGATVKFDQLKETAWRMVIFDEAHFLKNSDAQRSKAAKMIVKKRPIIQMLSGTLTMSRPEELWNLLEIAKLSGKIASNWQRFALRYCGGYKNKYGWDTSGATRTLELNYLLRSNFYIRREKRDVLDELPEVEQEINKTSITNQRAIQKATNNLFEYLKEIKGKEAAEKAMEAEHLVALSTLRKLAIDGKMKAIEQYLTDWSKGGKKLVVFGLHRENLEHLAEKYNCPLIAGGVTAKKKQQIVKDWIESDDIFLFANIQSAGTGVDGLQKICSNMLILELPWRPSDLTQVIGRLDRLGQKWMTMVTFMLNFNTIDLQMWQMLQEKEEVVEAVNKGIDVVEEQSGMRVVFNKLKELAKNNSKKVA